MTEVRRIGELDALAAVVFAEECRETCAFRHKASDLYDAAGLALKSITSQDAKGRYLLCGYTASQE